MKQKRWNQFFGVIIVVFVIGYLFSGLVKQFFLGENKKGYESSITGEGYGVSAVHPLAVQIGMEVLENGGNAVDASIAVSYALGVVEPYATGVGGGGGMLILPPQQKKATFVDYREISPPSGTELVNTVGIPGFVKGMEYVHNKYGSQTYKLKDLIDPSIKLAEKGFSVDKLLSERLQSSSYRLPVRELEHFFPGGTALQKKDIFKQPELAKTLIKIRDQGATAFYSGEIGADISKTLKNITKADLESYAVQESKPVYGKFAGFDVISAAPPFSGPTLIQALQMAEQLHVEKTPLNSIASTHILGEITKRAYYDREKTIGDPYYVNSSAKVKQYAHLTSEEYSKNLAQDISQNKLSKQFDFGEEEHESTTHFVIIDKDGMVVSTTNTLSNYFGSGVFVDGFFLNNQMTNFKKPKKGSPNNYKPGKRSRTFMAPTILMNDELLMGIGSPGGRRIPMMLAETLVNYLKRGLSLQDAINKPRFFIEGNQIFTEYDYPTSQKRKLNHLGYTVNYKNAPMYYGGIQALVLDKKHKTMLGGGDPRRNGTWKVEK